METWISPKAKKGLPSGIQGVGLFAIQDITKDEVVAVKAGHILTFVQVQKLNFDNHPELQIADDLFVCPLTEDEKDSSMLYINHSCNPNVGMQGDITFVAMKNIKKGEELVMDYAMIDNYDYSMNCNCGSENCRKIVTGKDFLLPVVKSYEKYLSAYIQSKLDQTYTGQRMKRL